MKKILISVGEVSGDIYAAKLIHDVRSLDPQLKFYGMGSKHMRDAGASIIVDSTDLAVVGLLEGLNKLRKIHHALKILRQIINDDPPDLVILIDYPGFNLSLAKIAKKAGCKVLYYISPQLWAWRKGRIKIIKKRVDKMAVILPFEAAMYRQAKINVEFVGHPLLDIVKTNIPRDQIKTDLGLNSNRVIGLVPGSRQQEINYLLPEMLKAAKLLQNKFGNLQFVLPLAPSLTVEYLQQYLDKSEVDIKVVIGNRYDVISTCDAIIATSGTVTLEIALLGIPMVIVYKLLPLTYRIAKLLVKVSHIGLCNIIAGETVAPELIQNEANAKQIAHEIDLILTSESHREKMIRKLQRIKLQLSATDNIELKRIILEMVNADTTSRFPRRRRSST